ncbi:MAG: TolC family protein, partial [Gammaproteobacteria bacterium]|nr:TolC family protein [Gammaproteobacteria bacterium]
MNLLPDRRRLVVAATGAALVLTLAGCADMGTTEPPAKLRDAPSLGLPAQTTAPVASLDAQWWRGFNDAQLDTLIEQALQGNPNLQVARARLVRAQSTIASAKAAALPQVNGQLDLTRQKFSGNYIYPAPLG